MLEALKQIDHNIFLFINQKLSSPWLDDFFRVITNLHLHIAFWIVMAFVFGFWIYKKGRRVFIYMIHIVLVAGLSDFFCYHIIKSVIYRNRPNNSSEVTSILKLKHGPQSSSFPSNHASTSFAIAATVKRVAPKAATTFFTIAALVAFSRPYLGVHFLSDVIAGAFVGLFVSWLYFLFLNKINIVFTQWRQS